MADILPKTSQKGFSTTDLVMLVYNFCLALTDVRLYPYQEQPSKRLIRSILTNDGAELTNLFARQAGKSEYVADVVAGLMVILPKLANMPMFANDSRLTMFKGGFWVGVFAPRQHQAQIIFNRVKKRLQSTIALSILESEFGLSFTTSNGTTVTLTNGSFVTSISASDQSKIEGDSYMLLILDECQDISNSMIRRSISPMGAAYNATQCKIGTATTFRGDFYYAIQRNNKEYDEKKKKGYTGIIRNHFEYDCDVAAKYNQKYAKYLEGEKKRLGEKSDEYQMSYKLKWLFSRGMFIEIQEFFVKCGDMLAERISADRQAVHVAGIDIGGTAKNGDPDSTVITIAEVDWKNPVMLESRTDPETNEEIVYTGYNCYLKDWCEIQNPDYEVQYQEIVDYLKRFNIRRCVCDATRETSIAHRLRANFNFEVIPFVFSSKSKSEIYKHLDKEINAGRLRVPMGELTIQTCEFDRFVTQLEDLQKDYSGALLVVSHPEGKGFHDDYPDSLALAVWGCSFEGEVNETETKDTRKVFGHDYGQFGSKNRYTARRRH